jgi:hypothetical protein
MHLISTLNKNYKLSEDWTQSKYIGITFNWNYAAGRVHLSMLGYHKPLGQPQNLPHLHMVPTYGAKAQYVELETPSDHLNESEKKCVQAVTGTLLTMLGWSTQL